MDKKNSSQQFEKEKYKWVNFPFFRKNTAPKKKSYTFWEKIFLSGGIGLILLLLIFGPGIYANDMLQKNRDCYEKSPPKNIIEIVSQLSEKAHLSKTPSICILPKEKNQQDEATASISTVTLFAPSESAIFISPVDLDSPYLEAILAHEVAHIANGDSYKPFRSRFARALWCEYGKTIEMDADIGGAKIIGFEKMIELFSHDGRQGNCGDNPHPGSAERVDRLKLALKEMSSKDSNLNDSIRK